MKTRKLRRQTRRFRIRAKVSGTAARPRLAVFRSNKALYAQIIDDTRGITLVSSSVKGKTIVQAKTLGVQLVEIAKKKNITAVVFDRGGARYHGVIKALADSCREGGLKL